MRNPRLLVFAAVLLLCLVGGAVSVVTATSRGGGDGDPAAPSEAAQALTQASGNGSTVFFLSLDPAHPDTYSHVAFGPADGSGPPTVSGRACLRLYVSAGKALCLAEGQPFGTYKALILDASLQTQHEVPLLGFPSRARISPDGRYGATTVFVTGHAYGAPGSFSTDTEIIDLASGTLLGNLETWRVTKDGQEVTAVDRNFWGVTFSADGDTFYATLQTGGETYLIRGSISGRTAETLHENVECPSLSPDGTRVAYKQAIAGGKGWHLHVLDLRTMQDTALADPESRDDQAEWLDDANVLYRVGDAIWTAPADGSGQAHEWRAGAMSPAVVRG